MSKLDPAKALRLAIVGRWIEHLCRVEARDVRRHADAMPAGYQRRELIEEVAHLSRLSHSWRARTLVLLEIDAGSRGDQHLDLVSKTAWERDAT